MDVWQWNTRTYLYLLWKPIYGSNFLNGEINEDTLVANSDAALGVHMNTVNGAPCCGKPIHLTTSSKNEYSVQLEERRSRLITFLRSSQKKERTDGSFSRRL